MTPEKSPPPYLTDAEIAGICDPLEQASAQIRYLRSLGMTVSRKPGGRALIARDEFRRVMVRQAADMDTVSTAPQPNREALRELFKGKQSGSQA